jgi:hypothetical protein
MEKEEKSKECCENFCKEKMVCKYNRHHSCKCGSGAIYGLGVVGALFYFLQNATTFMSVIEGIGKAIFWPAILMFKLLTYLQL